jgi:hypothetical protein
LHGLIHIELEHFVRQAYGDTAWERVALGAGIDSSRRLPTQSYDDDEIVALVVSAAKEAGIGPQAILEEFGQALVPSLLRSFGYLVDPEWRTLELVASTEQLIHTALRAADESARPPLLRTSRRGKDTLVVLYASERRMCGLAKGIVRGIAAHYEEEIGIREEGCMLSGDATCSIVLTRV